MNSQVVLARPILSTLALAAVLAGCSSGQATTEPVAEAAAIPVEVALVERGSVTAYYSTTTTLEADSEARVVPKLGGTIVEIAAEEGDSVGAGALLARIDADRYRLELERNEATLRRLEQDFNRHQEMQDRNLISEEAFERAKFEYEAHRAQVELSRLDLSDTAIRSPIAGIVSQRLIKVGNTVNAQEEAFVVTSLDPLLAVLHVPERELARLAVGQRARVTADAVPGRRFEGRIARISPVVDATTGTVRVTVEVAGGDTPLKPGMFTRVNVVHDVREDVLLIPAEAVISEDARTSVFVVEDGAARRRDVRVGYRDGGRVEISEGLGLGEQVVVTGQAALRDESKVLIVEDAAGPAGRS